MVLPDDVLLVIFEFLLGGVPDNVEGWHTLIHVCQQWRNIVLSSPRRLNLRLLCTRGRSAREMLDIWPALPIVLQDCGDPMLRDDDADNVFATLEHPDRVGEIRLTEIPSSSLEIFAGAMKEPFPALTTLELRLLHGGRPPVLPDSFFGGSVPRLRVLDLNGLPFSAVRDLLSSASHLVYLCLWDMPISGNAPEPKEIATCLSGMTKLESIELGFRSSFHPYRASRHTPSPITRVLLPALTHFWFQGDSGYLVDLGAHLHAPLLDGVTVLKPYWGPRDV
jgi:hypothetical protein